MSQADMLLNRLSGNNAAVYTTSPRNEGHIVVGTDRFITVPEKLKRIAVQFDHDIETVTFDCPRYWDEHDMSEMVIYVVYMRPDGLIGSYACDNVRVNPVNQNLMHFEWTIRKEATIVAGKLSFLVCVKNVDDEGNMYNHWNSELCSDMYISEGLEFDPEADGAFADIYPDIYTRLLARLNLINKIEPFTYVDDGNGNVDIKGIGFPDNIANLYSSSETYSVGDYCVYLGVLHKCIAPVTAPEEWDPRKWTSTNIADEMKDYFSDNIGDFYSNQKTYDIGDYCVYINVMYKCIVPITTPEEWSPAKWTRTNAATEILNCFTDVDNGKAAVASAITDMKVPTGATATFAQMAANIRSIKTGQGDAVPSDVREGVTFTNKTGDLLTGTSNAEAFKQATIDGLANIGISISASTAPATVKSTISGIKVAKGNATAADVKAGVTFSNASAVGLAGTSNAEAFKQATVDGLSGKGLGITTSTAPDTVRTTLQGIKIATGNATVGDVKEGVTFSNSSAVGLTGTSNAEAFKQATITGLANSGLGVTASTTPEQLLAILQAKFPAAFAVYKAGVLADGVVLWKFTNELESGGYLHARLYPDYGEDLTIDPNVSVINLTNYNTMTVTMNYISYANFGVAEITYGIDSANSEKLPETPDAVNGADIVLTIDVSAYNDVHFLGFKLHAHNQSSESTWHAICDVKIKKIELTT